MKRSFDSMEQFDDLTAHVLQTLVSIFRLHHSGTITPRIVTKIGRTGLDTRGYLNVTATAALGPDLCNNSRNVGSCHAGTTGGPIGTVLETRQSVEAPDGHAWCGNVHVSVARREWRPEANVRRKKASKCEIQYVCG